MAFMNLTLGCNVSGQTVDFGVTSNLDCAQLWTPCYYNNISLLNAPPPTYCVGTEPSSSFFCVNGVWTFFGTMTTPNLTISGLVSINGNLNITSSNSSSAPTLTVKGSSLNSSRASLSVSQCVESSSNLSVVVELNNGDIDSIYSQSSHQGSFTLLSQEGTNCSLNLSTIPVRVTQSSTCKQVAVSNKSSYNNLSLILDVNGLKCDLWWIILISVIGGLLVIGIVVFLIVFQVSSKLRKIVRPFSLRRSTW